MVPTLELPCIPGYHLKYADHGELEQDSERGYWLPVDAEPISTANWISNLQITDILEAMSAKHVMVIADSCYSGTIDLARLF